MLKKVLCTLFLVAVLTGCGTTRVWRNADMETAAVLKFSSAFKIEAIDGSFLSKPDFVVNMGTNKIYFAPGFHALQVHYDNGAVYTTGYPVSVSHRFGSQKTYRLFVHDRDKKNNKLRIAIKEDD